MDSYKKHIYEDFIKPSENKTKQMAREELQVPENQQFFIDLREKNEKDPGGKPGAKGEVNNYQRLIKMDDSKAKPKEFDNMKIRQSAETEIRERLKYSPKKDGKIEAGGLNSEEAERILKILQGNKK